MKYIALLLFFFVPCRLFAQPTEKELSKNIENIRSDWQVPGLAVGIIYNGEVVLNQGFGSLNSDIGTKVNENTLFAIASNTKAFIATALAMLVEEGKLDWNDRVIDHLPYFRLYDDYVTQETRVVDLLCHRVGLGTFGGDVIWYKSNLSADEVVKRAQHVPQAYGFRNGYGYTNLMFIAAGEVIKAASGKQWDDYIREKIFEPLEMNRTITKVDELKIKGNYADPHKNINGEQRPIAWVNWDNSGAAGGILSSTTDMLKWVKFHLDLNKQGESDLLDVASQNKTWTLHNNYNITPSIRAELPGRNYSGYGLGWGLSDYFGHRVVTHSGGYDGMYSRVIMLPDIGLGIVVLTNAMTNVSSPIIYEVINRYINEDERDWSDFYLERASASQKRYEEWIQDIKKNRIAGTNPSLDQKSIVGEYYDLLYGPISIAENGGKLAINFKNAPLLSATLEHWHYDTYEIRWDMEHAWFGFGTVMFTKDNQNKVKGIEFEVPNYDIFFHEIHAEKK